MMVFGALSEKRHQIGTKTENDDHDKKDSRGYQDVSFALDKTLYLLKHESLLFWETP